MVENINQNGKMQDGTITIDPADCDIVVGMYKYDYQTKSGDPMMVLVLETDTEDAKQVLWAFSRQDYYGFIKMMLNASELFEDVDNG